jgi:hypothetical protein
MKKVNDSCCDRIDFFFILCNFFFHSFSYRGCWWWRRWSRLWFCSGWRQESRN